VRGVCAIALIEAVTTAALLSLMVVGSIQALTLLNWFASRNRIFTNAQAIVQRNIDEALSVNCTTASVPLILSTTGPQGTAYSENGSTTVAVASQGSSSVIMVGGTLTRTVQPVANPVDANILQVTFRLDYSFQGRPYSCQMTTMRAYDD
jgi:hypothetical protein